MERKNVEFELTEEEFTKLMQDLPQILADLMREVGENDLEISRVR
ncbi:hypothetical protein [Pelosinus sp. sgz500959]